MDIFIARQPIFNRNKKVIAYELLSRHNNNNFFSGTDPDAATSDVIFNSLLVIGLKTITDGNKAFINFTENLLKNKIPTLLSKDDIAIEVLENIEPTEEIQDILKFLKKLGYTIVLDDFVFSLKFKPLLPYVDIIKVDFLNSSREYHSKMVQIAKCFNIKLLAEKVETREEFDEAYNLGYYYFQGYFFSKPIILSGNDIPISKLTIIKLLNKINNKDSRLEEISEIIKNDVSLSFKILKLVNSSYFEFVDEIKSIEQATALIGLTEIKKWISLLLIRDLSSSNNTELMITSLIRAKMGEKLSNYFNLKTYKNELFLLGIFSNIDTFTGIKMSDILDDIPLSLDIKNTLLHKETKFSNIYDLIINYEKGNFDLVSVLAKKII